MLRRLSMAIVLAASVGRAHAAIDAGAIAKLTGIAPEVQGGVAKVSVPRGDLHVTVDGVALAPFQGLTSWAAFEEAGDRTVVMGDLVLAEDEVSPAMCAALDAGLEVTALHNHFAFARPPVFFMHVGGTGPTDALATGVAHALAAVRAVRAASPTPAAGFGGPAVGTPSAIDPKPLEAVLGGTAQAKDGMAKFVFGRTTTAHGTPLGAAMGVNTWAAFGGSPERAVVDGDFAMLEGELQPVLRALCAAGIHVVAIHGHMIHEEPRIVFLHFWGTGPAEDLARGVRRALDAQRA
ncbi:MAG TPA: DUF1259 domain-containing protein [Candidatus Binatia bacterium]|nr:DUF1259 domain-containing protein [Candidatus Binatia bacterium]